MAECGVEDMTLKQPFSPHNCSLIPLMALRMIPRILQPIGRA